MSNFSGLSTSITGLYAHRQRIDTISENIANVDTPGYVRQRADLTSIDSRYPGLFAGAGGQNGGVSADVSRQWDELLDSAAKQALSRSSGLATQAAILDGIESELGSLEPGNLADKLQQLWNSFDDLANDPADLAVRNVVLGNVETVASELRAQAAGLDQLRAQEVQKLATGVERVNGLASTIAELDVGIAAGTASGSAPSGLIDQRDRLVTELASLVSANVGYDANGQVSVSIDGHLLVGQGQARRIELTTAPDPSLASLGYDRFVVTSSNGRELNLASGTLSGELVGVNELVPQYRRSLDDLAGSIVTSANALHQTGTALDGSTGLSLFEPSGLTATGIRISADVAGQPSRIAASNGSGTLDNSIARAMARLGSDPTGPSAEHAQMIADLGSQLATLQSRSEAASLSSERAEGKRQSASGVNLDEELADLITAQRAYEASARMISAIDEMLDTLINRTGLVGR